MSSSIGLEGAVLLPIGFALLAIILLWSLSIFELAILLVLVAIGFASRWFNVTTLASSFLNDLTTRLTPDQTFSEESDLIFKTRLYGRKIRLLRLLPGKGPAKLQCRLVEADLNKVPAYEAISYVWGRPAKRELIDCDGRDARVTTNLAQVLRQLRSETTPRTLWVDGICINLDNVSEKNHQVEMMGDIFKSAARVIIWLGPNWNGSASRAMAAIQFVNDKIPDSDSDSDESEEQQSGEPTIENLERQLEDERGIKHIWSALEDLFERQWFQRIWCMQEAILARRTMILCGDEEIDGILFGAFTKWLHARNWAGEITPTKINAGAKTAYRCLNDWGWAGTFLEILDTFRALHATDARDKVYGLIGLFDLGRKKNPNTPHVAVDYEKSLSEVLYDAVLYAIQSEGDLHFLSYVDHRATLEERGEYPSWLIRWDQTRESDITRLWCEASSMSAGLRRPLVRLPTLYSKTLTLKGFLKDVITNVAEPAMVTRRGMDALLGEWIGNHLAWIVEQSRKDVQKYHLYMMRLATTLTGGFIRADGWAGGRVYCEQLESDPGRQYMADFYAFVHENFPRFKIHMRNDIKRLDGDPLTFLALMAEYCCHRRLFNTEAGYIGLGPKSMKDDDVLAVLNGGKVPYILRPLSDGQFAFMGECFVYEVMDGRRLEAGGKGAAKEGDIVLR